MRNFLLGKSVAYASGADLNAVADGAIGFFYNKDGVPTVTATGSEITGEAMIVLGRPSPAGPVVLPFFKNHFSFVKGEYEAAKTFKASVVVPAPTKAGCYSIIVAKKGLLFNERNKWTATVHVKDTTTTAASLAEKLAAQINANGANSGVKATVSAATVTIEALVKGKDYAVLTADELMDTEVSVAQAGLSAYGDAEYIKDLASQAAADAGIQYTYRDDVNYLYPTYPLNPLAQPDSADAGYTVFTLRFAEPRKVKTRDEVVHQIIQVAFPTGAVAIETFETVCKTLAGEPATAAVAEE